MTQHKEPTNNGHPPAPLALHLRALRQWHGDKPLSQAALGRLVNLTPRQVRRYEALQRLPPLVVRLLQMAYAFGVPLEGLIAPDVLRELQAEVDRRRAGERLIDDADVDQVG